MLLYHFPTSTCSQKVRLVLAEKNLAWESRLVDLHRGSQFDPAYLALNPAGVVPTFDTGTHLLRESSIINEYLEEVAPQPGLMSSDPHLRALVRLWVRRLEDEVHPACGVLTFASTAAQRRARLESQGETIASFLAKVPDPARRWRQEEVLALGTSAPSAQQALQVFEGLIKEMGTALSSGDWLVGGACTLADLSYAPYLLRLRNLGLEDRLGVGESVRRWFSSLQGRPCYAQAITKWSDSAQEAAMRKTSIEAWNVG
jgi:glutathione S-transferase